MKRLHIAGTVALAQSTSVRAASVQFYIGSEAYDACAAVLNDGLPTKQANCTGVLDARATVREAEGSALAQKFCVLSKLLSGAVTQVLCFFILHARLRARRAPGIPCAL